MFKNARLNSLVLILVLTCVALLGVAQPASATPWWFALFTKGDGSATSNSEFERWHSFFVNQAAATDTVYVVSYTWGSGSIGPIDGVNNGDDVGLNGLNAAHPGNPGQLWLIGDNTGSNWDNAQAQATGANIDTSADGAGLMHNKEYFVANKGWVLSSANQSAGGFRSQHNNSLMFVADSLTAMMKKVTQEQEEKASGTFHDATTFGTINFLSPYGDTIELRYGPDDHDGSTAAGTGSTLARLRQLAVAAKESIFYMHDAWSSSVGTTGMSDDIIANNSVVIAGAAGDPGGCCSDWDGTIKTNMEADHTLRTQSGGFNRLHSKTMIFDMEIVATGSMNMSASATYSTGSNDEVGVIVHDFRLARKYMQHYHQIMAGATADPSADAYDNTAPAGATGLTVTANANSFDYTWTASTSGDVVRYYLFVDTVALTQARIGDGIDSDADGQIDEDPPNDADGFPSGSTSGNSTSKDDDADGLVDEDMWMYPEVMVKGMTSTSGTVSTMRVGDALQGGVNYYFAVVSVDTQGNEGTIATAGPIMLGAPDTKLVLTNNSVLADSNMIKGSLGVVAATFFIQGDTTTPDRLTNFSIENLGLADSQDFVMKLYQENGGDSLVTAADTFVAFLNWNSATNRYEATLTAGDTAELKTAGRTYLVAIDVYDTAGAADTVELRVIANTIKPNLFDTGPAANVTSDRILTIVSANAATVASRGDTTGVAIAKGDSAVVMQLNIKVSVADDTITTFGITNLGSMANADITSIQLYEDAEPDSNLTTADTFIANIPFSAGSLWKNTSLSYAFEGTSIDLIVTVNVAAGATGGATFQGQIAIQDVVLTNADSGPLATISTTASFNVPTDTSADTAIMINEYIQDPNTSQDHDNDGTTSDADEEYIELYNNSDGNVNVGGWDLDDEFTPGDLTLPAGIVMGAREFLVVYRDLDLANADWYRFDPTGSIIQESGVWTGTFPALNNSADSVVLSNASNTLISNTLYGAYTTGKSNQRIWDGADTWTNSITITPGFNQDPTAAQNNQSPNAHFLVTTNVDSFYEGESVTLTITMRNQDDATVAAFEATATLSSDTGTISHTTSSNFVAGVRAEVVGIVSVFASESVVLTVKYNTTTIGTAVVSVHNISPTIDVTANSDTASSNVARGDTDFIVSNFFIKSSSATNDTLSFFAITNLGTSDTTDIVVRLYRDEDADSLIGGVDTLVATLDWSDAFSRWEAAITDNDNAALGTTGKTFLVTLQIYDTATVSNTFQARVQAITVDGADADSGPAAIITGAGTMTIVEANPITITKRGDFASADIETGAVDSPVMAVQLSVTYVDDIINIFRVRNDGTMVNGDVSAISLYHDGDGDSVIDAAPIDTLITTLRFQSGSDWAEDTISYAFNGTSINLIVALNTAGGAALGRTFKANIPANFIGTQKGDTGPSANVTTTGIFTLPLPDTAGPNVWYVNDTSTTGDVYTSAVGIASNDGLTATTPKLNLNDLEGLITAGDTIYVDSGIYFEADTFTIDTNSIFIIGADSQKTIFDFGDSTSGNAAGIYAVGCTNLTLQQVHVRESYRPIWLKSASNSLIDRVTISKALKIGIYLENSDTNTLTSLVVSNNSHFASSNGIYGWISRWNTIESGIFSSMNNGIYLDQDNDFSTIYGNTLTGPGRDGITVNESENGTFDGNTITVFDTGIHVWDYTSVGNPTSGNRFTNNTVTSNGVGFLIGAPSTNNVYTTNTVTSNTTRGFMIEGSASNYFGANLVTGNSVYGFDLNSCTSNVFVQNTLDSHGTYGINISGSAASNTFQKTVFLDAGLNPNAAVQNNTANTIDISKSWWGTTDSSTITAKVAGSGAASVTYIPFRLGIVDTALLADTVAPNAPETVAVSNASTTTLTISWSAETTSEEAEALIDSGGWRIYRSPTSDTSYWELIGTTGPSQYSLVDSGLPAETTYFYRVTTYDNATYVNESFYSDSIISGTTEFVKTVDVRLNSNISDTNGAQGDSWVVASSILIVGDTAAADTLLFFAVSNLGLADSQDLWVELWRDEDEDSVISFTGPDTLVATLSYDDAFSRWDAVIANDSRAALGTSGQVFLITININDTATLGDTFQASVAATTIKSNGADSGPAAVVSNTGKITIVSANPVTVTKRGDSLPLTVQKGETVVVMQLTIGVTTPNDTIITFAVTNTGSMGSADVTSVRVYRDIGSDSTFTTADSLIAVLPFKSGSLWESDTVSYSFFGASIDVLVVIEVAPTATENTTWQSQIGIKTIGATVADSGPELAAVSTSALYTIDSDTAPDNSIVINEFIPNPSGQNHDNDTSVADTDEEFIELYNNSDKNVGVGGWKIDDDVTPGDATLPSPLIMGARTFLIVYDNDPATIGQDWYLYDSTGLVITDSGAFAAGAFPSLNNTSESAVVSNASNIIIDSKAYPATPTAGKSFARVYDGAGTWNNAVTPTPGKNLDPTASENNASPNAHLSLTTSPAVVQAGESFTITITVLDQDNATVTDFTSTVEFEVDTGTITETASTAFVLGTVGFGDSITGVAATNPVLITAKYNSTTSGTVIITVGDVIQITKGPNVTSETVSTSQDTITVIAFNLKGASQGDTLQHFTIDNQGLLTNADIAQVRLWMDVDHDSIYSSGDSLVAVIPNLTATRWEVNNLYTPFGIDSDFIVTIDLGTATSGETFQALITANTVDAVTAETGPATNISEVGILTVSTSQNVVIWINEVYVPGSGADSDFVELFVADDGNGGAGVDVQGWTLTEMDLGVSDRKVLGDTDNNGTADTPVFVRTGEYIVIYDGAGTDETVGDSAPSLDGNIIMYNSSQSFSSTDDEVALYDAENSLRDAVVWSNLDGGMSSGSEADMRALIGLSAWESAETVQAGSASARTVGSFTSGMSLQRSGVSDGDTYTDWGEGVYTPGSVNTIESPTVPPTRVTNVKLFDVADDFGGALTITWDPNTSIADFKEYRIWIDTQSLADLTATDTTIVPTTTITDSSTASYTASGLTNGASYYATVTIVDSWGLEFRYNLSESGPIAPVKNVTTQPVIRISEVHFANSSITEFVELAVISDGNSSGNLNLSGFKVTADDTSTGDIITFGSVVVSDGDFIVLWDAAGTSESDSGGDGIVNLYSPEVSNFSLPATDENLFVIMSGGDTILDFVHWSNRDGVMAAIEKYHLGYAIQQGAWADSGVFQNNAVNPLEGMSFNSDSSITRSSLFDDSNSDTDWAIDTYTPGVVSTIPEAPFTYPSLITNLDVRDLPNDFGGAIEVVWDPVVAADLHHFNVYRDTAPFPPNLYQTDSAPSSTVVATETGVSFLGLTNGETWFFAITAVDSYGNEIKGTLAMDSAAAQKNITVTPTILFSEVKFAGTDTEFIELRVINDGNPSGNLNLSGFKVTRDDTSTGDIITFGNVTVGDGDYIVLHNKTGTNETDSGGDGAVWIYGLTISLAESDENLFLIHAGGDTILDFVAWSNRDGAMSVTEQYHLGYAIQQGAWRDLGSRQNNTRTPFSVSADFDNDSSITRASNFADNNSDSDWAIDSPTPGSTTQIAEAPLAAPGAIVAVEALDVANDVGDQIKVRWTAVTTTDLHHYNIYRSLTPFSDSLYISDSSPSETTPSYETEITIAGLTTGETYYFVITAVDSYGNEHKQNLVMDSAAPLVDTTGPNVWYINDGSTTNDSYTTSIGYDTNIGVTPAFPLRTLSRVENWLTAGDTVYVDAGTYTETFVVLVDTVWILGADSSLTIIDPGDSTTNSVIGIKADTQASVTISDLTVQNAFTGIYFQDVDFSTVQRVTAKNFKAVGISLDLNSWENAVADNYITQIRYDSSQAQACISLYGDSNTVSNNKSFDNYLSWASPSFVIGGNRNIVRGNLSRNDSSYASFWLSFANYNTISSNQALNNLGQGFIVDNSQGNVIRGNVIANNSQIGMTLSVSGNNANLVTHNTFDSNGGFQLLTAGVNPDSIQKNNVLIGPNNDSAISLGSGSSWSRNWWGSADSSIVNTLSSNRGVPFRLGLVDTGLTADSVAPSAPDTVSAGALGDTTIRISWSITTIAEEAEAVLGLSGYRILRGTNADTPNWQQVGQVAAGTETFDDSGLGSGETWYYRVTAFDAATQVNESFFSDSIMGARTTFETTPPDSFSLIGPTANVDTTEATILFQWQDSNDTTPPISYRLIIDTDLAGSFIVDSTIFDTFATHTLDANDTYQWRVIAIDSFGNQTQIGDSLFRIDTLAPTIPSLVTPSNAGETNATTIFLDWTDSLDSTSGLQKYHLQVDTGGTFTSGSMAADSDRYASSDTTMSLGENTYYWRVVAYDNATNTSAYSTIQTFVVDQTAPVIQTITFTASAATFFSDSGGIDTSLAEDTIFFNNVGAGASQQDTVTVTLTGGDTVIFPVNFGEAASTQGSAIHEYGYSVEVGLTDTQMVITAEDTAGNQDTIQLNWSRDISPPPAATPITPSDSQTTGDSTPALTWAIFGDTQSGALGHRVQISGNSGFTLIVEDSFIPDPAAVIFTASSLNDSVYYWRVISYDTVSNADTAGATVRSFVIDSSVPSIVQITITSSVSTHFYADSPVTPGLTADTVFFNPTGSGVNQMDTIIVYVQDNNESVVNASPAFNVIQGGETVANQDTYTLVFEIQNDSPSTTITINVKDATGFEDTVLVHFESDTTAPTIATQSTPADGTESSSTSISLTWAASSDSGSGLANYTLQISTDSVFSTLAIDSSNGISASTTVTLIANDTYFWRVVATDNVANTSVAAFDTFLIDNAGPIVGQPLTPSQALETSATTIVFTWSTASDSLSGLAEHRLQIDTSGNFSSLVTDSTAGLNLTGAVTLTANDTYYWRIVAYDNVGNTTAYADSYIIIDNTGPVADSLITPLDNTETNLSTIIFTWGTGSDPLAGLASYRLQVDTLGTFVNATLVADSATTSTSETLALLTNDTYRWRVIFVDDVGNTTVSNDSGILIDVGSPNGAVLDTPISGVDTGTPTTLKWIAGNDTLAGIGGYIVQVDTVGTFTSLVLDGQSQTATETTISFAADTYFWRVITVDGAGNMDTTAGTDSFVISTIDTTSPETFTLLNPATNAETNLTSIVFSWKEANDSDLSLSYRVIVDTATFNTADSVVQDTTVSETSVILTLSVGDTYEWRVIATDQSGNTTQIGDSVFLLDLTVPILAVHTLPANAAGTTATTIGFSWVTSNDTQSGFSRHQFQLDNSGNFTTLIADSNVGTNTDTTITGLTVNDTYYWRIVSYDDAGNTSATSATTVIIDTVPPLAASLILPATAHETSSQTVGLSWTIGSDSLSGVAKSHVEIDTTGNFIPWQLVTDTSAGLGTDTTLFLSVTDTYYWRIVTHDNAGNTTATSAFTFLVDATPPGSAVIILPAADHETSSTTIGLLWTIGSDDHSGLNRHQLQIDTGGLFTFNVVDSNVGTNSGSTVILPANDTYYVRLISYDDVGNTSVTSTETFIIDNQAPSAVVLDTPINGIDTSSPVTMKWSATSDTISGVAGYIVQVDTSGSFTSGQMVIEGLIQTAIETTASFSQDTFYWRVIAVDGAGNTTATTADSFKVLNIDTTAPQAFSLLAPADNTETGLAWVVFQWTESIDSNPVSYRLIVDTDLAGSYLVDSSGLSGTSVMVLVTGSDTYKWRVIASDLVGNTTASTGDSTIIVDTQGPSFPSLVSPINGDTRNNVSVITLDWDASNDSIAGVLRYRLQIDTLATFAGQLVGDSYANTPDTTITIGDTGTYYWRVIAEDEQGNTTATSLDSFVVVAPSETVPPDSFSLISPTNNAETSEVNILFQWQDSSDSSLPISYRLIVDTDMLGSYVIDTTVSDTMENVTLPANDTYLWRVIARDAGANLTTIGDSTIVIDTAGPDVSTLVSPVLGSLQWTNVSLDWTSVGDAISGFQRFRIQLDTSGNFNSLLAADSLHYVTDDTGLALADDTYYWRIIAEDDLGNTTASSAGTFVVITPSETTPPSSFNLTSPSDNKETNEVTITFRWTDSTDSSTPLTYRLIIDTDMAGAVIEDTTITDTEVTITLNPNDTYLWRVIAKDASGNTTVIGDSTIIVDTAPPTISSTFLDTPIKGETVISPAFLDWGVATDSIAGVVSYTLQVDTSGTFDTTTMIIDSTITGTETNAVLDTGLYYWRVVVTDEAGNTITVTAETFYVEGQDTVAPLIATAVVDKAWVTNSGSETVVFTVTVDDSNAVLGVFVNLAPIGGNDSHPLTRISGTNIWVDTVVFDTTVAGDTYDFRIKAVDPALNFSDSTVRVVVSDATPSLATVNDTPYMGQKHNGDAISIVSTYGDTYTKVRYEYRPEGGAWTLIQEDTEAPFWGTYFDADTLITNGDTARVDVRAVGTDKFGVIDTNPEFIRVLMDKIDSTVQEFNQADGSHVRRQKVFKDTDATLIFADGGTSLMLTAGSITEDSVWIKAVIELDVPGTAPITGGLRALNTPVVRTFIREDGKTSFAKNYVLTLPYNDTDPNDDAVGVTGQMEKDLAIYHWDETFGVWVKEPTSVVDPVNNTVTCVINHFTIFAIIAGPGVEANLDQVVVYPNPFIPYDGNAATGVRFDGADPTSGILFDSLTTNVDITIYNISGRAVAHMTKTSATGRYQWDARNDGGRDLASGIYLAVIRSGQGHQTIRKIMIIR